MSEEDCSVDVDEGAKGSLNNKPMDLTPVMKRSKAWYMVALMSLCYGVGELSHFLVGTTSRDMAQVCCLYLVLLLTLKNDYTTQDLQYGDQSCLTNDSVLSFPGSENITCSDFGQQET